ncbi:hypothetical protein AVEN_108755-1 [Araneus ventricosus]|uniref:Uncharacterized protein n=1 Tax=Araneus ventricosus TaxID=182803 RepID=A0A4Y2TVQ7_ARAVE|nr:hypothetical protein AVEN_108755-1 [Araneus ventricosus]
MLSSLSLRLFFFTCPEYCKLTELILGSLSHILFAQNIGNSTEPFTLLAAFRDHLVRLQNIEPNRTIYAISLSRPSCSPAEYVNSIEPFRVLRNLFANNLFAARIIANSNRAIYTLAAFLVDHLFAQNTATNNEPFILSSLSSHLVHPEYWKFYRAIY